jgi:hypothetical protein
MPFHVVRQHTEEDVSPDSVFEMMENRTDLEVHTFEAAKCALCFRKVLVVADCIFCAQSFFWFTCAHHVNAIQRGFLLNLVLFALKPFAMVTSKCLAIL